MWKFDPNKGLEPIPGLPIESTDDEFDAALKVYAQVFGKDAPEAVKKSGLYKHTSDKTAPPVADKETP